MRPRVRSPVSRVPQLPPAQNEELADRERERRAQERRAIPRRERPRDSISHPCSCDHFDL